MEETAQEIYEYSRRGRLSELECVLGKAHPDSFVGYDGSTALLMACKNGYLGVCELLVKHGADLSKRGDDGSSALLLAACSGNVDLVKYVLSFCANDINECNEDGFTPLDMALHYNKVEVVRMLESHGGFVSSCSTTPEAGEMSACPSEKWGYGVFD